MALRRVSSGSVARRRISSVTAVPVARFLPMFRTCSSSALLITLALSGCGGDRQVPPAPSAGVSVTAEPAPALVAAATSEDGTAAPAAAGAPAAETAPLVAPGRLSRTEAVRLALTQNRGYLQRESARDRAEFGQDIARSQVYAPTLHADYTRRRDGLDDGGVRAEASMPLLGFEVRPFATSGWTERADPAAADAYDSSVGVTVSRRLLALHEHVRQRLPITQAETDFFTAANDLVLQAKQLELDANRAFFAAQNAAARVRVRERRVTDARQFLAFVGENVKQGFKAPVEELFASISLNQAEADLVRERAALRDASERLLSVLALPISAPVDLIDEDVSIPPPAPARLEADLARLNAEHEELANLRARIELARERLKVTRDAQLPVVTAGVTAERRYIGDRSFDGGAAEDDTLALTLSLDMPLDLQRAERARYRQGRAELKELELGQQESEARLEGDLRSVHRRIERLLLTVQLAERRLAAERSKLDATLKRYEAGAVDNLEVTRAKQELDDAEVGLLDARIELALAAAEYRAKLPAQRVAADAAQR